MQRMPTTGKGAADAELERAAAFRAELRRFLRRTEDVTTGAGLTPQRYDLLLMIKTAGADGVGVRVTELCELLQLQQPAVTELVKRAEEARLVVRRSSAEDGRVSLLSLTPEGDRRLMKAFTSLQGDREALAGSLRALDRRLRLSKR